MSESPTTTASGGPGGLSFAEVFRDHAPFLWRATVALGVPERDADDLCQEVMLVVHRKLGDFKGGSLRSWLYSICLRVTSDYRRSARVRRERPTDVLPEGSEAPTQAAVVDVRRAEARLFNVLEALEHEQRVAFVFFEIEQLTLQEIAEATDAPLQTVYSRLKAARARVRGAFEEARQRGDFHETG